MNIQRHNPAYRPAHIRDMSLRKSIRIAAQWDFRLKNSGFSRENPRGIVMVRGSRRVTKEILGEIYYE